MATANKKMVCAPSAVACALNQAAGCPADGKAQPHAQDNLLGQQHGDVDIAAGREGREHRGEHVGDGAV